MDTPSFVAQPGPPGFKNSSQAIGPPAGTTTSEVSTRSGDDRPCGTEATFSNGTSLGAFSSGKSGKVAAMDQKHSLQSYSEREMNQPWAAMDHSLQQRHGYQSPPPAASRDVDLGQQQQKSGAQSRHRPRHASPCAAYREVDSGLQRHNSGSQQSSSSSSSRPGRPASDTWAPQPGYSSYAWDESRPSAAPGQYVPNSHAASQPYAPQLQAPHAVQQSQIGAPANFPPAAPPFLDPGQARRGPPRQAVSPLPAPSRSLQPRQEMRRGPTPIREVTARNADEFDQEAMALCGIGALLQTPTADPRLQMAVAAAPSQAKSVQGMLTVSQRAATPVQSERERRPREKIVSRCLQCRQEPSSYLDHTCPKCGAMVCATCLEDFKMVAASYRCPRCGDEQASQERLQRNLWMINAMRSTQLAFGQLGRSIQDGIADLFEPDAVDDDPAPKPQEQPPDGSSFLLPSTDTQRVLSPGQNSGGLPVTARAGDGICSGPTYQARRGKSEEAANVTKPDQSKPEHRTRPPADWFQGTGAGMASLFGVAGTAQAGFGNRMPTGHR